MVNVNSLSCIVNVEQKLLLVIYSERKAENVTSGCRVSQTDLTNLYFIHFEECFSRSFITCLVFIKIQL